MSPLQTAFIPHVVVVDERPVLVMNTWEAVLALFEVRASLQQEEDRLTRLQILAIRCALGLMSRQEAHAQGEAGAGPDAPSVGPWLDLYIDTYLARSGALATAHTLLAC